jgi:hypothetical protein
VLAGESLRGEISAMVREKTDSIIRSNPAGGKVIIAGDFNCTPDDNEIRSLVEHAKKRLSLTNLSGDLADKGQGTYRYRGTWEMIDQVIVSEALLSSEKGLFTRSDMLKIFSIRDLVRSQPIWDTVTRAASVIIFRYCLTLDSGSNLNRSKPDLFSFLDH